jgi:hypothetical protein
VNGRVIRPNASPRTVYDVVRWTLRCSRCRWLRVLRMTDDVMFPAICEMCRSQEQETT